MNRRIIVTLLVFFLVMINVSAKCINTNHIRICFSNCIVDSICKLNFNATGVFLFPSSQDYFILSNKFTKIGGFLGVKTTRESRTIEIVPKKNVFRLDSILYKNTIINPMINITEKKKIIVQTPKPVKKRNNKIILINIVYILFVTVFIIFLFISEIKTSKLEKKHKKEIEKIIKEIENNIDQEDNENLIPQDIQPIEEPKQVATIPVIRNKENEILKRIIIEAKMKGIPEEVLRAHLMSHYNKNKVKEFMRRYY